VLWNLLSIGSPNNPRHMWGDQLDNAVQKTLSEKSFGELKHLLKRGLCA